MSVRHSPQEKPELLNEAKEDEPKLGPKEEKKSDRTGNHIPELNLS